MKTNEQLIELLHSKQFHVLRDSCIERLNQDRTDVQAWASLGDAMVVLKRGNMALLCYERLILLDPYVQRIDGNLRLARQVGPGITDEQVLELINVQSVTVSACIITRDSSRTIRQCLEALQSAVDEIVVVDTGSSDDTISIVESFGIKVHHFEWIDDFSAARNYALSLVTSEWVLSADSDEILYTEDKESIRIAAGLFNDADFPINIFQMNSINGTMDMHSATRLFKASKYIWKYPIHETVFDHERDELPLARIVRIRLFHDGYDPSIVDFTEKMGRNISILKQVLMQDPTNLQFRYYFGRELSNLRKYSEAIPHLEQSLKMALNKTPDDPECVILLPDISLLLNKLYKICEQKDDAKKVVYQLTQVLPDYPDGWYNYGLEVIESPPYNVQEAIAIFTKAQQTGVVYRGPAKFDPEIGAWKATHTLGQLVQVSGSLS